MNSPLGVRLSNDNSSCPFATPETGRTSTMSIQLKTVVLAAMPTASASTATSVNPGLLRNIRSPNRRSRATVHMRHRTAIAMPSPTSALRIRTGYNRTEAVRTWDDPRHNRTFVGQPILAAAAF